MGNNTLIPIDQSQVKEEPQFQVNQNLEILQNSKPIGFEFLSNSSQFKENRIQYQQVNHMDDNLEQFIQNVNNEVDQNAEISQNSNSTHQEFFQGSPQFDGNQFQDEEISSEPMDQIVHQQEENESQNEDINQRILIHQVFGVIFHFIINLIYHPPVEIENMPQRQRQSNNTKSLIQKIIDFQTGSHLMKNFLQNMVVFLQKYIRENELQNQVNSINQLKKIDFKFQKKHWSKEELTILVREWEGFDIDTIFNLRKIQLHINESIKLGRLHQRSNEDQNDHDVVTQLIKAVTFVAYRSFMRQAPHIRNQNVPFDKLLDKQAQFQLHELENRFTNIFPVQFELWRDILG